MEIFEFCLFYIAGFSALTSLTPLGTFPPRDIVFSTPALGDVVPPVSWSIPWIAFIGILASVCIVAIVIIVFFGNASFLGSGLNINTKYLSTIVAGFTISAGVGTTMTQMLPADVPLIATFFLVYLWCILLVYSVIMYAGTGHD